MYLTTILFLLTRAIHCYVGQPTERAKLPLRPGVVTIDSAYDGPRLVWMIVYYHHRLSVEVRRQSGVLKQRWILPGGDVAASLLYRKGPTICLIVRRKGRFFIEVCLRTSRARIERRIPSNLVQYDRTLNPRRQRQIHAAMERLGFLPFRSATSPSKVAGGVAFLHTGPSRERIEGFRVNAREYGFAPVAWDSRASVIAVGVTADLARMEFRTTTGFQQESMGSRLLGAVAHRMQGYTLVTVRAIVPNEHWTAWELALGADERTAYHVVVWTSNKQPHRVTSVKPGQLIRRLERVDES